MLLYTKTPSFSTPLTRKEFNVPTFHIFSTLMGDIRGEVCDRSCRQDKDIVSKLIPLGRLDMF